MDLSALSDRLPHSPARICWVMRGQPVRRSAAELHADVQREASRLAAAGVGPGWRVGIRAANSYRWLVVDLALLQLRAQSVAFTADFDGQPDAALVRRYALSLLFIDVPAGDAAGCGGAIIALADPDAPVAPLPPEQAGCDLDFDRPWLAFSSGSAGGVKGLLLSRRGVEAAVAGVAEALGCTSRDALLLFLPMSNFQQRMLYYGLLWQGGELILADPVSVFATLRVRAPTLIVAPPVFYELICARVGAAPRWQRAMLAAAGLLAQALPEGPRLWLRRRAHAGVHQALGGRIRLMITGMAPTRAQTLRQCRRMGLPLYETYGQIEAASIALNRPGADRPGSVGRVLPGVELRFGGDGEILVRRAFPVTIAYAEAAHGEAEQVFLPDDWVATGDIGSLDGEGFLHLHGRKKLQLISPGGEKFHPEVLEQQVEACPGVRAAVAYQDAQDGDIRLIISAEREDAETMASLRAVIARHNRAHPGFCVTREVLTGEVFSVANGLLRPNLKIDRAAVIARFAGRAAGAIAA